MPDPSFMKLPAPLQHHPRGRIAIFKNGFLGRPLRAKGFAHREMAVAWQVMTHNLWVLARLEQKQELALAA